MEKYTLTAAKRTVLGRQVKTLRKAGKLPANIYGNKIKSVAIELPVADFDKVFKKAGETAVVELDIAGKEHPVLIHNIQYDPITNKPIHVDFYEVDLTKKVTAKVSINLIGESPAVINKVGTLLTLIDHLEIEALPRDLPEKIEVSVEKLADVDQTVKVSDVTMSSKVKVLTGLDVDIVKVAPLVSKEAEKMAEEAQAAKAAASAQAAETPAAGDTKAAPTTQAPAEQSKKEEAPKKV